MAKAMHLAAAWLANDLLAAWYGGFINHFKKLR
jgi:hypothetical protein